MRIESHVERATAVPFRDFLLYFLRLGTLGFGGPGAGAPFYHRFAKNAHIKAFVQGVTAAAVGAISGAAIVLGRRALIDIPTVLIALTALTILFVTKKTPEPILILAAGAAGVLLYRGNT